MPAVGAMARGEREPTPPHGLPMFARGPKGGGGKAQKPAKNDAPPKADTTPTKDDAPTEPPQCPTPPPENHDDSSAVAFVALDNASRQMTTARKTVETKLELLEQYVEQLLVEDANAVAADEQLKESRKAHRLANAFDALAGLASLIDVASGLKTLVECGLKAATDLAKAGLKASSAAATVGAAWVGAASGSKSIVEGVAQLADHPGSQSMDSTETMVAALDAKVASTRSALEHCETALVKELIIETAIGTYSVGDWLRNGVDNLLLVRSPPAMMQKASGKLSAMAREAGLIQRDSVRRVQMVQALVQARAVGTNGNLAKGRGARSMFERIITDKAVRDASTLYVQLLHVVSDGKGVNVPDSYFFDAGDAQLNREWGLATRAPLVQQAFAELPTDQGFYIDATLGKQLAKHVAPRELRPCQALIKGPSPRRVLYDVYLANPMEWQQQANTPGTQPQKVRR